MRISLKITALFACTSLSTVYSFVPAALLSLRSPGGALRSDSEHASACAARTRGISMMATPAKGAAGGAGFGAPKKAAAAPKTEEAPKEFAGARGQTPGGLLNFDEAAKTSAEVAKTKGAEPSPP